MKYSRHFPDFFCVCVYVCHASSHFKLSFIFISIYILLFHVAFPRLLQLFAKKKQRKSFSRHRGPRPLPAFFICFSFSLLLFQHFYNIFVDALLLLLFSVYFWASPSEMFDLFFICHWTCLFMCVCYFAFYRPTSFHFCIYFFTPLFRLFAISACLLL